MPPSAGVHAGAAVVLSRCYQCPRRRGMLPEEVWGGVPPPPPQAASPTSSGSIHALVGGGCCLRRCGAEYRPPPPQAASPTSSGSIHAGQDGGRHPCLPGAGVHAGPSASHATPTLSGSVSPSWLRGASMPSTRHPWASMPAPTLILAAPNCPPSFTRGGACRAGRPPPPPVGGSTPPAPQQDTSAAPRWPRLFPGVSSAVDGACGGTFHVPEPAAACFAADAVSICGNRCTIPKQAAAWFRTRHRRRMQSTWKEPRPARRRAGVLLGGRGGTPPYRGGGGRPARHAPPRVKEGGQLGAARMRVGAGMDAQGWRVEGMDAPRSHDGDTEPLSVGVACEALGPAWTPAPGRHGCLPPSCPAWMLPEEVGDAA